MMASLERLPQSPKCNCCPYGFHIDLDFVDFVANITGGTSKSQVSKPVEKAPYNGINDKSGKIQETSPLDSMFSDSLENVVSDFDETFQSKGFTSDREHFRKRPQNSTLLGNGYHSDYESPFTSSLPPKAAYRTALGRTISEIRSRHRNESKGSFRKEHLTSNDYNIFRQNANVSRNIPFQSHVRTPYEHGKVHHFGSKTPDFSNRPFSTNPTYDNCTDTVMPIWRIRSPVLRSASAVDMDGFASTHRCKKLDNDGRPPVPSPHPRKPSLFPDRLRRELSSPPLYNSTNSSMQTHIDTENVKSAMNGCSNVFVRTSDHTMKQQNGLQVEPKDYFVEQNDSRYPVKEPSFEKRSAKNISSSDCLECINLKNQLKEMVQRLTAVSRKYEDVPVASENSLSYIGHKNASILAKPISKEQACTTIPRPQYYSIGINTDNYLNDHLSQTIFAAKRRKTVDCGVGVARIPTKDSSVCTDKKLTVDRGAGENKIITAQSSSSMTYFNEMHAIGTQTEKIRVRNASICTWSPEVASCGTNSDRISMKDSFTICDCLVSSSIADAATTVDDVIQRNEFVNVPVQTDPVDLSGPRVLNDTEIAESLWLMPHRATLDIAVGNDGDVVHPSELLPTHIKFRAIDTTEDDEICVLEESLSDPEAIDFEKSADELLEEQRSADVDGTKPRALGQARAAIVKKLLTERTPRLSFIRGSTTTRSWRPETKKGDSLQYIADMHETQNDAIPSTPQTTKGALKEKVVLKKDTNASPPLPSSKVPEPVPARIPRPKFSKYIPGDSVAQSPDEEAEVADRLTPLRSEMRNIRSYTNGRVSHMQRVLHKSTIQNNHSLPETNSYTPEIRYDDDSSSSSSDSEGSYDTNEALANVHFEMTPQLSEAIRILKQNLENSNSVDPAALEWAIKFAKHEWLKTAARKTASAIQTEGFIDAMEAASIDVLRYVVNMTDPNKNTALHYAVSHGNFDVVSVLLDSKVCNLDRPNKAGYTPVMLAALCDVNDEVEAAVIHRLYQMGNVNEQAVQHGQTALMLAVSHGKMTTTKLLIDCQADLNIQDEEGSTALMCAAEHGHKDIVKLLLSQPDINASLSDCDSSTALSIAVENGHRDIGLLIYAHLNHARMEDHNDSNNSPKSIV